MKFCLYVMLFFLSLHAHASHATKICYFSLNNKKEFTEMEKFTKKLNKYSKIPIEVEEFVTTGADAEESFQRMVDSGVKCDGLVISGHHTGSFGGANASSNLSIDFMEKLSCDEKNKDFFNNIKALWLQGCRTLGVGQIESYESADFHMSRVGAVLEEDHLSQSFADLNMEFSATLDQDNPLSSRYLRVFPRATTFGWTATAPGEKSRSEFSIPFHIAHIASLNDDRGVYFDNPVSSQLDEKSAVKYMEAMLETLGRNPSDPEACINRDEEKLLEAWKRHGNSQKGYKYSFYNADLNAYPSLLQSDNQFLKTAKEYECLLKKALKSDHYLPIIDEILKDESLIGYSFNSIYELVQRLQKEGDIEGLVLVRTKLQSSDVLNSFLMKKLTSKELGSLRRIDYYAFWKEMTGKTNESIENNIQNYFVKMMLTPTGENDYNARDFKVTLSKSMGNHGLLSEKDLKEIVNSEKTDGYTLGLVADEIRYYKKTISGASEILQSIVKSDKSDKGTLSRVAQVIGDSKATIAGSEEVVQTIVKSGKTDEYILGVVAAGVVNSKSIGGASEIVLSILESDKASKFVFSSVAMALGSSKEPIAGYSKIVEAIKKSNKIDPHQLNELLKRAD